MQIVITVEDHVVHKIKELLLKKDNFEYLGSDEEMHSVIEEMLSLIDGGDVYELMFQYGSFPSDFLHGQMYFPDKKW